MPAANSAFKQLGRDVAAIGCRPSPAVVGAGHHNPATERTMNNK